MIKGTAISTFRPSLGGVGGDAVYDAVFTCDYHLYLLLIMLLYYYIFFIIMKPHYHLLYYYYYSSHHIYYLLINTYTLTLTCLVVILYISLSTIIMDDR